MSVAREVMNKCNQTRISRGFSLIVDDSGHRKSGNFTAGVGRQYIGEIGKTDNGNVVVTTHRLGARSLGEETSPGSHRYMMAKKATEGDKKKLGSLLIYLMV